MQKTLQKYSIVWVPQAQDSEMARRVNAAGEIQLPHFVSRKQLESLECGEGCQLAEYNLLFGLLVEYFTPPPMSVTHKIRPYFKDVLLILLDWLKEQSGYGSYEECILNISDFFQKQYGGSLAKRTLKAGLAILPESEKIRIKLVEMEASKDA